MRRAAPHLGEEGENSLLKMVTLVMCQVEAEYLTRGLGLSVPGVVLRLRKNCFQALEPEPEPFVQSLWLPLRRLVLSPG